MDFKLTYLGKELTIVPACNSKGYWISRQIQIGLILNSQLAYAYPINMDSHNTHIYYTDYFYLLQSDGVWWGNPQS